MSFEETELRLGLPGNGRGTSEGEVARKRGFCETETITMVDLKLNLSSKEPNGSVPNEKLMKNLYNKGHTDLLDPDSAKPPPPKAQVVGWPPIRKNRLAVQKGSAEDDGSEEKVVGGSGNAAFVKVSLDGAPYLRKVDLNMYNTYKQLSNALAKLFGSFTIGNCGSQAAGMKDAMNESKLIDLSNGSDYVPTYQDKDGDWMLVGDVPWQMFVESCKRLRIMKGKEAIGLAPRARAVEKCKNYKS